MDADTSLIAKSLIILAALSMIAAFRMTILNDRRQRELLDWVRTARPAVWRSLPRKMRWLPEAAMLARLRRELVRDNDFAQRDMAAPARPTVHVVGASRRNGVDCYRGGGRRVRRLDDIGGPGGRN